MLDCPKYLSTRWVSESFAG